MNFWMEWYLDKFVFEKEWKEHFEKKVGKTEDINLSDAQA